MAAPIRGPHLDGQAELRRRNLALLVGTLREQGALSRAQLAVRSGLAKSTVSDLVIELERRRLVRGGGTTTGATGRPGRLVALRPESVVGVGLDVQVGHVGISVTNLAGDGLHRRRVRCDVPVLGAERALDQLAELATGAVRETGAAAGPHVTVSVPGLVDEPTGAVVFAPRLRWRDVAVADGLAARTGMPLDRVAVHNDANLAARAEHELLTADDLVYLSGGFSIGGAMVTDGILVRGASGFAGEVGHLTTDPLGPYCSCGRRGCLETGVGLGALLHACADPDDAVRDPALELDDRMRVLRDRAEQGDRRTLDALHQVGSALGLGVAILVNLLDPAVVVLGGYFAALADWLVEPVRNQTGAHVLAHGAGGATVVGSRQGTDPAAGAAAAASVRRVFDDPTIMPLVPAEGQEVEA